MTIESCRVLASPLTDPARSPDAGASAGGHPRPAGLPTRAAGVPAAGSGEGDHNAVLGHLIATLAEGEEPGEVASRVLPSLLRIAGARAAAVRVLDSRDHRMHLVGALGLPAEVVAAERSVEHDCGFCGAALAGERVVWAEDLTPCARRHAGLLGAASGMHRVLTLPLQRHGRVLGLLNLFYDRDAAPAPDATALLESIGKLLGLALDNARLEREELAAKLLAERQAMAADLHDSIGQSLAFAKMRLILLEDAIKGCDQASAERYYDDVRSAIGQAHASLRSILTQARAPIDPRGLEHALQGCVQAFRRSAGVALEFVNEAGALRMSAEQESQTFHIVQEALTNIARHAHAQHAWLHVRQGPGATLHVVVEDDGAGLDPGRSGTAAGAGTHYGLAIMQERARRLKGELVVEPRAGGGTRVRLDVPLRRPALTEAG